MATNLQYEGYGHETPLFAPTFREAPWFYQDRSPVRPSAHAEVSTVRSTAETIATGLPMYMGETVSQQYVAVSEGERVN